jgi:hypothetical protein
MQPGICAYRVPRSYLLGVHPRARRLPYGSKAVSPKRRPAQLWPAAPSSTNQPEGRGPMLSLAPPLLPGAYGIKSTANLAPAPIRRAPLAF